MEKITTIFKSRLALDIFFSALTLNSAVIATEVDSEFTRTKERTFQRLIIDAKQASHGSDGEALNRLAQNPYYGYISCVAKEGNSFVEYPSISKGRRQIDKTSHIPVIYEDQKKGWELLKENYNSTKYDAQYSLPREKSDPLGNKERIVFTMDPNAYVVEANSYDRIKELIKQLNEPGSN